MKYVVNEGCIGCGLCASTCPEVFSLGDNGVAVAVQDDVSGEYAVSADEAKNGCPVGAIEEA